MANEVIIEVKADTDKAQRGFKNVGSSLQNLSKRARTAGIALSAMGAAGTLAFKSFVGAALEQRKAVSVLTAVIENLGVSFGSVEQKVMAATSALQEKTSIGDERQIRALAIMVPILGDVDKALAALPAILDASAASGMQVETVSKTLTRALSGQVHVAESVGATFDKDATFAERLAQVLGIVGGAAAANKDPFEALNSELGDLKELLGDAILPVLLPIVEKFTEWARTLKESNPTLVKTVAVVAGIATAFAVVVGPLLILASLIPMIAAGLTFLGVTLGGAVIVGAVVALGAALFALGEAWRRNLFGMQDATERALEAIIDGFVFAMKLIAPPIDILIETWNRMTNNTIPTLTNQLDKLGDITLDFARKTEVATDRSRLAWDSYRRSLPVGADWGVGGAPDPPAAIDALPTMGMTGGTGRGGGGISIATGGGGGGGGEMGGYGNLNEAMKIFADPRSESGDWTATNLKATGIGAVMNEEFGRVTMPRTVKAQLELAGRDMAISIGNTFEDDMENYEGI